MAEVDGKVVMQSGEGHLYQVAPEDVANASRDQGWTVAPDDAVQKRIEERAQYSRYGSTGQQALGAAETAVRTATFGVVPGFGSPEDIAGRSQVLREQSPVTNFLAQAAGAAVPALATGGIGGALTEGAEGASLAGRLLGGASVEDAVPAARLAGQVARGGVAAAEGLSSSTAAELEQAQEEGRAASVGNILMYGVGGELLGRAVPALIREGAAGLRERLLSQAGASAATGAEGVLAGAERRALESSADVADGVPVGPDRDTFLAGAHRQIVDTATERATKSLDELQGDMRELAGGGGSEARARKVDRLVAKTNDAQRDWAADTSQGALDLREELRGGRASPKGIPEPAPESPATLPDAEPSATDPPRTYDYAEAGLGKFTRQLSDTLTGGSKALDEAAEGKAWFRAANDLHGQLGSIEQRLERYAASSSVQDPAATESLLGKVREYRNTLRQGVEREDLWGDAARYQQGMNQAVGDGWTQGARVVEKDLARNVGAPEAGINDVRYDPSKVRAHLAADPIDRGVTPEFLEKQLQGAERAIQTHQEFGTASKEQLARMRGNVDTVREQLALADDVRGAKARVADREGVRAETERVTRQQAKERAADEAKTAGAVRDQKLAEQAKARADQEKSDVMSQLLGVAVGAAAHSVGAGAVVTVGTKLLRMRQLLDTLGRAGEATVGSAAKGAVYGRAGRLLASVERGASAVAGSKATVPLLQTAMARFQGDYPSIQTAFEAKKRAIDSVMQNPLLLHRAIAQHLGPMSKVAPEVYGQVSARLQAATQYLHDNLPSQMSASMVRPSGIPLSRATARDFALKWNSAMNPASVFQDVRDGRASPTQLRTLATVHPDLYQSLHLALVRQVAQNPGAMTTQRKLRLDILFDSDGIAGRAFSWPLATAIKSMHAGAGPSTGALAGAKATTAAMGKSTPSRGLSAIKSSVTNAA